MFLCVDLVDNFILETYFSEGVNVSPSSRYQLFLNKYQIIEYINVVFEAVNSVNLSVEKTL